MPQLITQEQILNHLRTVYSLIVAYYVKRAPSGNVAKAVQEELTNEVRRRLSPTDEQLDKIAGLLNIDTGSKADILNMIAQPVANSNPNVRNWIDVASNALSSMPTSR